MGSLVDGGHGAAGLPPVPGGIRHPDSPGGDALHPQRLYPPARRPDPHRPGRSRKHRAFLPETALTREALLDDGLRLVFQTEDTYQVAEESAGHPLVFALFTPEGWIFTEQGAYTFTPDVAASDLWLRDLSSIVQSYVSFAGEDAWPAGEYTFGYYIDGQTAAEYTFTLE